MGFIICKDKDNVENSIKTASRKQTLLKTQLYERGGLNISKRHISLIIFYSVCITNLKKTVYAESEIIAAHRVREDMNNAAKLSRNLLRVNTDFGQ